MSEEIDRTEILERLCRDEVKMLSNNLCAFLENSILMLNVFRDNDNAENFGLSKNVFALIAFERFRTQLTHVYNNSRKFNSFFNINNLNSVLSDASKLLTQDYWEGASGDSVGLSAGLEELIEWATRIQESKYLNKIDILSSSATPEYVDPSLKLLDFESETTKSLMEASHRLDSLQVSDSNEVNTDVKAKNQTEMVSKYEKIWPPFVERIIIPQQFENDLEFHAYVSHIENPKKNVFYIFQKSIEVKFNVKINSFLTKHPPYNRIFGYFDENLGGIVRAVLPQQETDNSILLIDYGKLLPLSKSSQFYNLPNEYQNIPAQAICCKLECLNDDVVDKNELARMLQHKVLEKVKFSVIKTSKRMLYLRMFEECPAPKIKSTTFEQKSPNSNNPFTDQNNNGSSGTQKMMPELSPNRPGEILTITVTHVPAVDYFYAQIDGYLYKPLYWYDSEITPIFVTTKHLEIGDIVLAQYNKDNIWYRARVLEMHDENNDTCKVFFVDYGNTEIVSSMSLAQCPLMDLFEPLRAMRFRIDGIVGIPDMSEVQRRKAAEALLVLILDQTFNVEVIEDNGNEKIITFVDNEYISIPETLIEMKCAKHV